MWTPSALASEFSPYAGFIWRLVEGQHVISTNRLADSTDDQRLLEGLAEEVKPDLPPAARALHLLIATPFRYGYGRATRFRQAYERPGIFYASEHESTAVAETAYGRLLFFARSPEALRPRSICIFSSFNVEVAASQTLDLTAGSLVADQNKWTHPTDYSACQALAALAREAGVQAIRYVSVRDPEAGRNVAVLDPGAFRARSPSQGTTWSFKFEGDRLSAFAAFPSTARYTNTAGDFGIAEQR